MICIALSLKSTLQEIWKQKKSEELVYYQMLKIVNLFIS